MTAPRPDDLPPEWLAAYADGELTPTERARVERWLADHPEARELLDAQEALGPANADFWAAVRPPAPSSEQWDEARKAVRGQAPVRPQRSWSGWLGAAALAATAAGLILAMPGPHPCLNPPDLPLGGDPAPSPADDEPYPMAVADDVRIISLPEAAADLIVVGRHPLGDSNLVLARTGEIEFHGIGADLAGRFPELPADPAPDDFPMLWAPRDP